MILQLTVNVTTLTDDIHMYEIDVPCSKTVVEACESALETLEELGEVVPINPRKYDSQHESEYDTKRATEEKWQQFCKDLNVLHWAIKFNDGLAYMEGSRLPFWEDLRFISVLSDVFQCYLGCKGQVMDQFEFDETERLFFFWLKQFVDDREGLSTYDTTQQLNCIKEYVVQTWPWAMMNCYPVLLKQWQGAATTIYSAFLQFYFSIPRCKSDGLLTRDEATEGGRYEVRTFTHQYWFSTTCFLMYVRHLTVDRGYLYAFTGEDRDKEVAEDMIQRYKENPNLLVSLHIAELPGSVKTGAVHLSRPISPKTMEAITVDSITNAARCLRDMVFRKEGALRPAVVLTWAERALSMPIADALHLNPNAGSQAVADMFRERYIECGATPAEALETGVKIGAYKPSFLRCDEEGRPINIYYLDWNLVYKRIEKDITAIYLDGQYYLVTKDYEQ